MKTTMIFTAQDIRKAEEHNSKMYERRGVVKNTRSLNAHIKGYLGELIFKKYCEAMKWPYEEAPEHTGNKGDNFDFIVAGHKIDVKVTKHDYVIRDDYQARKATEDKVKLVLVNISKDLKEGIILGWAKPEWEDLPQDHYFWKSYPDGKWKWIPSGKLKLFEKTFIF